MALCDCKDPGPLHNEAVRRGVHHHCWKVGPMKACQDCYDKIMAILDERYNSVDHDSLRTMLYTDHREGRL